MTWLRPSVTQDDGSQPWERGAGRSVVSEGTGLRGQGDACLQVQEGCVHVALARGRGGLSAQW